MKPFRCRFFFSSRRRHTRCGRDWSSDVCSSDLTWYRNGGEPRMGRELRALFNDAAVTDLRITASVWCYATPSETLEWGESYAQRLLTSPMGGRAVEYGYATHADLEAMAAA